METDHEIVRRVRLGDRESFRDLVVRYQARLLALIRSLLRDGSEAEDVAQETFLAAYRHLDAFDPGRGTFAAWLFRIARNRSLNALKKRRPVPVPEVPEPASPPDPFDREEAFRRLDRALLALPFPQRAAFVMAEIQGLSHEEIGRIEGVARGTVKSRIGRAREKLRAALAPRERCP